MRVSFCLDGGGGMGGIENHASQVWVSWFPKLGPELVATLAVCPPSPTISFAVILRWNHSFRPRSLHMRQVQMLKLKLQYFGHLMRRTDSLEKTLMLGKTEGRGEGDDRGWDGWMASPTWWTWIYVDSGSWWWTGRPGVLRFMGSQSRTRLSDWTDWQSWMT